MIPNIQVNFTLIFLAYSHPITDVEYLFTNIYTIINYLRQTYMR